MLPQLITRIGFKSFRPRIVNRTISSQTVNIFDRNVKKLQRERAAVREDAELYDYIKDEVGFRLSDRIFDVKRTFKNAVDLGASRGYVTNNVLGETVEKLTACDISPSMLKHVKGTPGLDFNTKVLDEEKFDFEDNSLDLVISNLSLHWINDLPACFKAINKSLQPDGVFMASMFGGETLFELRSSLQLAEQERKGGLSPHVSPFTQIRDVGMLLNTTGFTMLTIDTDEITVGYPSMFELMHDLKGMAENNAAFNRPLHLSRETMLAAAAIYKDMYGKDEGITATFQIIYFVGWKYAANQPQPVERGSANVSFKDLDKMFDPKNKINK